jgi:histidine triad (HIT) family protein
MNACVFCDLIEAGDALVADRPAAAAFLPRSPLAPGHTLVVPRRHVVDMFAAEDEDLAATMQLAREVAGALRDVAGAQGVNLLHASGEAAEQSVFHLHFHVVPRWSDDNFTTWPSGRSGRAGDAAPEHRLRRALELP